MIYITKRDGRAVLFNKQKIINAVLCAFEEVDGEITEYAITKANNIADYVNKEAEKKILSVEEIQDMVEHGLMSTKRKDVARAYISYRNDRNIKRQQKSELIKNIKNKIFLKDVQNQNANVDEYSFGGRNGEASSMLNRELILTSDILSERTIYNHINNRVYVHDLDHYILGDHNCLSVPFDKLLEKGFNTRQASVRPAGSINTAFQLIAVIFQLQSLQQFGGVSATHLDWTMVPYVRKSFSKHMKDAIKFIEEVEDEDYINSIPKELSFNDREANDPSHAKAYNYAMKMTERELQQAVEGMYHNLNTLQSRSGNQLPFTSINYGTCTLPEGRMVIKALLEGSLNGIGEHHTTSIFPCGIFQLMKGINREEGDPNYDLYQLAIKSTAKRLYPNYANVDWSGNAGYDKNDPKTYFSTMGCRTANGWDINGFGQLKDGRGNICPVTIILPTLAMEAKESLKNGGVYDKDLIVKQFMVLLNDAINDAKDTLIDRFEYICSQDPRSAKFMYENGLMEGYVPEEGIRSALKHGTLAMGQLGLAEALQILIGCNHTTEQGMALAKDIENLFKTRCSVFKETYKLNFGVYYSPAENLCYTALKKFRDKYGVIPKVSDKEFFTNSMHVPVWEEIDPFTKIDIESQLTGYSSAGCITYVELDGGMEKNTSALETLINYAMDHDIPYFAINVPNDTCNECGFTGEFNDKCPECGSTNFSQLRRVTGYLTGNYKTAFNNGKINEVENRIRHSQVRRH